MATTLEELRQYILNILDEDDATPFGDNPSGLDIYIKMSYNRLVRRANDLNSSYFERETGESDDLILALGSGTVTLPSNLAGKVITVKIVEDKFPEIHLENREKVVNARDTSSPGKPTRYAFIGGKSITFNRVADANYVLRLFYEYLPEFPTESSEYIEFIHGHEVAIANDVIASTGFRLNSDNLAIALQIANKNFMDAISGPGRGHVRKQSVFGKKQKG
jgi:hypothetical protein